MAAGAPYAECEVMKMFMPLLVAEAGVLSWGKPDSATYEPGDFFATVQLNNPAKVKGWRACTRCPAP